MVVDTSIVLAVFFNETHARWAAQQLERHAAALRMSTVNLCEVLILIEDRQPQLRDELRERLLLSSIRFVPPSVAAAEIAASARMRFPLNLGDCFAYALAKEEGVPLLTLDSDFRKTDLDTLSPAV